MPFPQKLSVLFRQFLLECKLYGRDRVAVFWAFLFPLLMLLSFGLIFRSMSNGGMMLVWVARTPSVQDSVLEQALASTPVKVVRLEPSLAEARWLTGKTAVQLETAPDGNRLRVNSHLVAQGMPAAQIVQVVNLIIEAQNHGVKLAPIPMEIESPGHSHLQSYAGFLLPGLLGLNLLTMGLFTVGTMNVVSRDRGRYKRIAATPLPKWVFLGAQVMHRLMVVLAQSAVLLIAGWLIFGVTNQGSFATLAVLLALGTFTFMAMGFALSSLAGSPESYSPIANGFFFPMMLMSGVYFTLDSAPTWLQKVVQIMPLSPFMKALRGTFNDGATLGSIWPAVLVVGAWGIAAFYIAIRKFRWI
jgi:ABC-2 type transport system permease protein